MSLQTCESQTWNRKKTELILNQQMQKKLFGFSKMCSKKNRLDETRMTSSSSSDGGFCNDHAFILLSHIKFEIKKT